MQKHQKKVGFRASFEKIVISLHQTIKDGNYGELQYYR